jgi:beta-lactamase class A
MISSKFILAITFFVALFLPVSNGLEEDLKTLDDQFSGNFGVYIKYLNNGTEINHDADRDWYLASTVKIPIAIAILQRVEDGELSLEDTLTLQESDFVDGSGDLIDQEPGSTYTVGELLERMIRDSDSTATDMLIRMLGQDSFNQQVRSRIMPDGMGEITTILQVRYDAYAEISDEARNLTNLDIINLRGYTPLEARYQAFLDLFSLDEDDVNAPTLVDAFERYYERGLNSGYLTAMGEMLEKLHEGEYLNEEHTNMLLDTMESVTTGDRRIKANLPEGASFAHKTGTQIGKSCNIGIVNARQDNPVVVAVCIENYFAVSEAEEIFMEIGAILSEYL